MKTVRPAGHAGQAIDDVSKPAWNGRPANRNIKYIYPQTTMMKMSNLANVGEVSNVINKLNNEIKEEFV
jgi:hypothetical protein